VSLDVFERDFIGLIGPNGSGKTTFVNVVTGVYRPDEGEIYFENKRIDRLPRHKICRIGIARTFQIPQPLEDLSVWENVQMGDIFCGVNDIRSVKEALKISGLYDKRFYEASKLTLIEKRLLELARALAVKPRLLFLDEVAAGLREDEIKRLGDLLVKLNNEGVTVIWIEHNVSALLKYVKRLVVMNMGYIIADGDPQEVINKPQVIDAYLGKMMVRS